MQFTDEQIRALLQDPARHPPSARHPGCKLIDFSVAERWAEVAYMPRPEFARAVSFAPCSTMPWV
jgi:hypothetical protein